MIIARLLGAALAAVFACFAAAAGPLDGIYDDAELVDLAPLYERGWRNNYENVFRPAFSPEEKARLDGVRFRMELRVRDNEPFAFMAGGGTVIVSAASLRFLEDVSMAHSWLERKGYTTQTLADYLLMLRYWKPEDGRPPRPWDALCIPANAFDDPDVADLARKVFNTAAAFVLLHEYGHVLHRHPGNRAVTPEVSRKHEQQADRFAMDQFVRVGDMPAGVPVLFLVMTHLLENRADFSSDVDYRNSLAARTHPVSPDRIQSLARHMSEMAQAYERNARPGSKLSVVALALQISQLGHLLADPDLQRLSRDIGLSAKPAYLAPRRYGRHLSPPCGAPPANGDFHGAFHGEIDDGKTSLPVDALLQRDGDAVTGVYSYGAGYGDLEGAIEGSTLTYRWTKPPESGTARLTLGNGEMSGTWGLGDDHAGGGAIRLRR